MPERVSLIQIDQPLCTKTWGSTTDAGFCGAHLSVTLQKCQNTRKTCAVPLDYAVDTALILPGSSGNYASTPDTAGNSITGDLDIRMKVAMGDWTPAAEKTLLAKWVSTTQKSWQLNVLTDGKLKFYWSADGSAELTATSSVTAGITDGATKWVRATIDVDNGAAGRDVKFWLSDDYDPANGSGNWTQLGSTQTSATATSIFNSTSALEIGSASAGTSGVWSGKAYAAEVRNGIGGTVAALFVMKDAIAQGVSTVTSSATGEVWTVNTSGSPKAFIVVGFRTLQLVTKQSGTQRYYNAAAEISAISTDPATLNLAGMDGRSEDLLGQREEVSVSIDDSSSADVGVDPYRFERPTGVASQKTLSLPGSSGNYAFIPDSAANSITGDLSIRIKAALADWTPVAIIVLASKWTATGNQRSYKLEVLTDGKLRLSWSTDGTAVTAKDSTAALGFVDGSAMWLLATIDVNNGAAGNDVKFFKSTDYSPGNDTGTWTQVGATVTTGGTTSIFDGTSFLAIGAENAGTSGYWSGSVYYADVRASFGTGGTAAMKFDPQSAADRAVAVVDPVTAGTWTLSQSGSPKAELIASPAGYDSYASGTKYGKWLARNPYCVGYPARVYDGEMGQTTVQMCSRYYLVKGIDGPTRGAITLSLRDVFDRITARKAVCPKASRGELFADLTGSPATFQLFPSGIGAEYLAAGYVCIGSEIIQYTLAGDVATVVARAALGSTQADHKDEDLVQQVAVFSSMTAKNIVYAMLVNETTGNAGVPTTWINQTDWATASAGITELYSATIAKPTPIGTLVSELMEQAGFTVFPNVATGMIDFVALRASAPVATIDDETWIKEDSFVARRLDIRRVSQCWVHYGQKDATQDLEKEENFRSRIVVLDAASEAPEQYGTPSIKTIFSRWIPQFGRAVAESAATRIVGLFRDPPLQAEFRVPGIRASSLSLAATVTLRTSDIQDAFGARRDTTHAIVRLKRDSKANEVELRTLETKFGAVITDKTLYIENDVQNFNFRTEWERQWGTPSASDTPKVVLLAGIFVGGGTAATSYAFTVGLWPAGVVPQVQIDGEILPAGGQGGDGGSAVQGTYDTSDPPVPNADESSTAGGNGRPGAHGLVTTIPITLSGTGVIRGGFGGGGGGGGAAASGQGTYFTAGGGPGGGARGFPGGTSGTGGGSIAPPLSGQIDWTTAGTGTKTTHGAGGGPQRSGVFNSREVEGGAGASNGTGGTGINFSGQSLVSTHFSAGGSVGSRGNAIIGNSLVTQSGWTGTIDGATVG